MAPDTPFGSTGPISRKATSAAPDASTTSWLTSTSPGRAEPTKDPLQRPRRTAARGCPGAWTSWGTATVDIDTMGMAGREDPVHVPTTRSHDVREAKHLGGVEDAVEVGSHRDAVVTVERRELAP